jgi:predicted permease
VCLGAGAARVVRQIGIESLLLSAGGGIVGVGLAAAVVPTLSGFVLTAGVASQAEIKLNVAAVAVAAGLVVLAGALFGIGPALHAIRLDPVRALRGRFGTTAPPHAGHWRAAIVATQVAIAFPVFCVALALVESLMGLHAATAKYGPDHLLLIMPRGLELETERYRIVDARARLWRELDAAIQAVPGVLSTASTAPLALNRTITAMVEPIGGGDAARWESQLRCASPNFFSTMNISVVRGRTFDPGAMARQRVAVVSRSFARTYFGEADPLGHHVRITKAPPFCPVSDDPLEIVGVVEDTQLPDMQTGNAASPPTVYVSTDAVTPRFAQFLVRTSVPAATIRRDVQRAIAAVNPELVGRARSLEEDVEGTWMPWPRLLVRAALSCSAGGLLLVLVGVFGLLSYLTAQLTREIGIRMALGASPAQIGRHVLGRGMRWAGMGMAVGTAATFALQALARSRIWGLTPLDVPLTGAIAALVMIATGVLSWFPARRAMRIDPVAVIRSE